MRIYPVTSAFSLYLPTSEWEGRYDSYGVEVARGGSGVFLPLTGSQYLPASIMVPRLEQYDVVGKTLDLLVNGHREVSVTFASAAFADVLSAIAGENPAFVTAILDDSYMFIQTVAVGVGAALQITGGDAAPALYHTTTAPAAPVYGQDTHRPLLADTEIYSFVDPYRDDTDEYRFYYFNTTTGVQSPYSPVHLGATQFATPRSELIIGNLQLLDMMGRPTQNAEVVLYVERDPSNRIQAPQQLSQKTDETGRVSFLLLRGLDITVSVTGVGLMHKMQIPTTGDTFDLLDPSLSTEPDNFEVQVPKIVVGARRTL